MSDNHKFEHYIVFTVYMFGAEHRIGLWTAHTLEEIKSDWGLREELCTKAVLKEMNVQRDIEEV